MKKTAISAEEVIQGLAAHRKHTLDLAEAYYGPQHRTKKYLISEENPEAAAEHRRFAEYLSYAIHCVEEMNRQGVNRFDF